MTSGSRDSGETYVKCKICGVGMRSTTAANHIATHLDAGDLIQAAHQREQEELHHTSQPKGHDMTDSQNTSATEKQTAEIPDWALRSGINTALYRHVTAGTEPVTVGYRPAASTLTETFYTFEGDVNGGPATGVVPGRWEPVLMREGA